MQTQDADKDYTPSSRVRSPRDHVGLHAIGSDIACPSNGRLTNVAREKRVRIREHSKSIEHKTIMNKIKKVKYFENFGTALHISKSVSY